MMGDGFVEGQITSRSIFSTVHHVLYVNIIKQLAENKLNVYLNRPIYSNLTKS